MIHDGGCDFVCEHLQFRLRQHLRDCGQTEASLMIACASPQTVRPGRVGIHHSRKLSSYSVEGAAHVVARLCGEDVAAARAELRSSERDGGPEKQPSI